MENANPTNPFYLDDINSSIYRPSDTIIEALITIYNASDEATKHNIRTKLLTWLNEEKTREAFARVAKEI